MLLVNWTNVSHKILQELMKCEFVSDEDKFELLGEEGKRLKAEQEVGDLPSVQEFNGVDSFSCRLRNGVLTSRGDKKKNE